MKYFPFENWHQRGNTLQKTAIAITLLSGCFHPHPSRTPRQWGVDKSVQAAFPPVGTAVRRAWAGEALSSTLALAETCCSGPPALPSAATPKQNKVKNKSYRQSVVLWRLHSPATKGQGCVAAWKRHCRHRHSRTSYSRYWVLYQKSSTSKKTFTGVDRFDTSVTLTESVPMSHITLHKNIRQQNARCAWDRCSRERGISSRCKKWEGRFWFCPYQFLKNFLTTLCFRKTFCLRLFPFSKNVLACSKD